MEHRRFRTFHILSSLNRRGAEADAVWLADRLRREVFEPVLWTIIPARRGRGFVPERTPVHSWGEDGQTPHSGWRAYARLVRALRAHRPHLVHCHGGRALKYAMLARPFWRAPVYVYANIGSVHPWLDPPLKRLFYGALIQRIDAIVSVGEAVRREVETMFHPENARLVAIVPGVDLGPFAALSPEVAAEQRAGLGLNPTDVCLISVGSLSWEKNPRFLLRLYARLRAAHPHLKLILVGGGPEEAILRDEAARYGISAGVHLLGVRDNVPAVLSAADIFLLPSITEGLPLVLIEAGLAALPAVTFRVGSVEEVVRDEVTGFVVPQRDEEAFVRRVEQLLGDPALRAQMGRRALARCRTEFDLDRCVRLHERLYLELLEAAAVS